MAKTKKRRKAGGRRGYHATDGEARQAMLTGQYNETCPKCETKRTCFIAGPGRASGYYACHDCGREWGWTSRGGRGISRTEYCELASAHSVSGGRGRATSLGQQAVEGDSTMATKKKAVKKAVKKVAGEKRETISGLVLAELVKNPEMTVEQYLKLVGKAFPDSVQNPSHLGRYRSLAIKRGIIKSSGASLKKAKKAKKVKK